MSAPPPSFPKKRMPHAATLAPSIKPAPSMGSASMASSSSSVAKKSPLQHEMPQSLIDFIAKLLPSSDLVQFCRSASFFQKSSHLELSKRKKMVLFSHVFKADPDSVKAFFERSIDRKIILIKDSFQEGYQTKETKEFVCVRRWGSVSPLQAAALSGNNFILRNLLSYIVEDPFLRLEAANQLQEVLARKSVLVPGTPAVAATMSSSSGTKEEKVKAESKEDLEAIFTRLIDFFVIEHFYKTHESRYKRIMKDGILEELSKIIKNGFSDDLTKLRKAAVDLQEVMRRKVEKSTVERKMIAEMADVSEYLAPYRKLIKAYEVFILHFPMLDEISCHLSEPFWEIIGECQKRLPMYGLQEYFEKNKPFEKLDKPPENRREFVQGVFNVPFYIEELGEGNHNPALVIGYGTGAETCTSIITRPFLGGVQEDLRRLKSFYESRKADVENIVTALMKPGSKIPPFSDALKGIPTETKRYRRKP